MLCIITNVYFFQVKCFITVLSLVVLKKINNFSPFSKMIFLANICVYHTQARIQDLAQAGGRDFAREARAIFFAPHEQFSPPLSASQGGGRKLLRGERTNNLPIDIILL